MIWKNILLLNLAVFVKVCVPQGAPWSCKDAAEIKLKILQVIENGGFVMGQFKKLHPELVYEKSTAPNGAKLLRLGFHDCLTYTDGASEDGINGCDGCLNSDLIGLDLIKEFDAKQGQKNGPNMIKTSNNGLLYVADILEEIYTNPNFPKNTPELEVSIKDSGKSRADLWAFAALVAAGHGIHNNNLACKGEAKKTCGHLREEEEDCMIEWPISVNFRTGRKDCIPDPDEERPFLTSRLENHPSTQGNGRETVDFYKANFGFTAREGIALTGGAHSLGRSRPENSFFKYPWSAAQENILNNQLFRQYSSRPQYFLDCKDGNKKFIGDAFGNPANTTWRAEANRFSVGGGPYQWHQVYDRCEKICTEGDNSECCANLEPGMQCNPSCVKPRRRMETSLPAEMGFYWKFESDPETGMPSGCPNFDNPKFQSGKRRFAMNDCEMEDYAPEGVELNAIVDEFADDQQAWLEVFVPTLEKMLANGYENEDLVDGPEI